METFIICFKLDNAYRILDQVAIVYARNQDHAISLLNAMYEKCQYESIKSIYSVSKLSEDGNPTIFTYTPALY